MATIKDIANKLGVSISTVSKGLNGAHDISDEMRKQVLDTAIELGYANKKIKSRKNQKLCILIDGMEHNTPDQFGYDIILGFKQAAVNSNWDIDVVEIDTEQKNEDTYDSFILKNSYHGAFLLGFNMHDRWVEQLSNTIVPTVTIDNYIHNNPKVGTVGTDSYEGISFAINHLAQLGHKHIAFLNGDKNSQVSRDRNHAFEMYLEKNNLPIVSDLIRYGYYVMDSAKEHVAVFLENGATAIVCASDLIASSVIYELHRLNKRVPEDVSVIGFDDIPIASRLTPQLTTIRQDRKNIGKSAYILLDGLINDVAISKMTLRAEFIERESTSQCSNHI